MLEAAAALGAGTLVAAAILVAGSATHEVEPLRHVIQRIESWWRAEKALANEAGWPRLSGFGFVAMQVAGGACGAIVAYAMTDLPVLALPAALGSGYLLRSIVVSRALARRARRQDAVLEAVRMMRQLLEIGATSVNQAIAVLADRGPGPLRGEFRLIAARSVGRRQAWKEARDRVAEPLFDMLAAAVLIQRPGGGELAPLFADLEASVSSAQEVEREARALQAQARSASSIIVVLPLVFLIVLSTLHSPYLNAFHQLAGQMFLLAMLAVMAVGYAWMRRLLDLPSLQRVRLSDA